MKFGQMLVLLLICSSCGSVVLEFGEDENGKALASMLRKRSNVEYVNQLSYLGDVFLTTGSVKEVKLSKKNRAYLEGIYKKIVLNNNVILNKKIKPSFHIIKNPIPFCFSIPSGGLFISSGLVGRYLDHELILVSLLSYEIIRMHKDLYAKNIIVPVGFISLDRMLSLTRLPPVIKHEIGKFTYYAMTRSGYDALGYLMWLQVQNKNVLDFRLQLGNSRGVAMEEFLFKQFIIKKDSGSKAHRYDKNSSSQFYSFIRYMKRRGTM